MEKDKIYDIRLPHQPQAIVIRLRRSQASFYVDRLLGPEDGTQALGCAPSEEKAFDVIRLCLGQICYVAVR